MSDKKISQLPAASDTDVGSSASYEIPVVVNGTTKKVSNSQVLAPVRQELQSTDSKVTQLSTKVGDLSNLNTDDVSSLVNAINEVLSKIGSGGSGSGSSSGGGSVQVVNNLSSTSTTAALSANMGKSLNDAISALQNLIGTKEQLQISNVTDIVDAINKVKALVDALAPADNLTSDSTTKPLSAKQGKALKALIDDISGKLGDLGDMPVADAIGAINDTIGDAESMVQAHGSIVGAIDSVEGRVASLENNGGGSSSGGGSASGTTNYNDLTNKPSINGVSLVGNKTLADLGISGNGVISAPTMALTEYTSMKINGSGIVESAITSTNIVIEVDVSQANDMYVLISGVRFASSSGNIYRWYSIQDADGNVLKIPSYSTTRAVMKNVETIIPSGAAKMYIQGTSNTGEYPTIALDNVYNNSSKPLFGRTIVVLGDSTNDGTSYNVWTRYLQRDAQALGCNVIVKAVAGSGWSRSSSMNSQVNVYDQWGQAMTSMESMSNVDDPIVIIDTGGNETANLTKTYEEALELSASDYETPANASQWAVHTLRKIISDKNRCSIFLVSNWHANWVNNRFSWRLSYRKFLEGLCDYFSCPLIDMTRNSQIRGYLEVDGTRVYTTSDRHLTNEYGRERNYRVVMNEVIMRERPVVF